jgi:hypothetical protein
MIYARHPLKITFRRNQRLVVHCGRCRRLSKGREAMHGRNEIVPQLSTM